MSMKGNFLTIFFIFLKCLKKISEPHYIWLFFNANFIIFLLFYHFKSAPLCYGGLSLLRRAHPTADGTLDSHTFSCITDLLKVKSLHSEFIWTLKVQGDNKVFIQFECEFVAHWLM